MRNVIIWHWFIKNLVGTWRRNDVDATSLRRIDVITTSLRRHVPAGNLAPSFPPPNILNLGPPNILNLPTPMGIIHYRMRMLTEPTLLGLRSG